MVLLSLGYQEVAAFPPRPQRFSTREHSCSAAAAASHTCQWENRPEGMAKLLVTFKSAAIRHSASTDATSAAGLNSVARTRADFLFRSVRLLPSLGPFAKRIRTTMA